MNIDSTIVQKYAPALFSALVLILPAADILAKNPTPIAILQFAALIVTTATTFALVAPWKQAIEWLGVVIAAVLPLALSGDLTWANWALVAVAVVKAFATHLGVIVRRDESVDAATILASAGGPPIVTTLTSDLPEGDAVVADDGLADPANAGRAIDGPEHRASSTDYTDRTV